MIEGCAKAVDVGCRRDFAQSAGLFRADVVGRSERLAGFRFRGLAVADRARQAQIGQLRHAGLRDHDVLGLDVAVNEALLVRVLECLGDLLDQQQRFAFRNALGGLDAVVHGVAVDILHHEVVMLAGLTHIEGPDDVLVVQLGCRAAFLVEARDEAFVAAVLARQDLDRHQTVKRHLLREIHRGHGACAQLAHHLIAGDRALSAIGLEFLLQACQLATRDDFLLHQDIGQLGARGQALLDLAALLQLLLGGPAAVHNGATHDGVTTRTARSAVSSGGAAGILR